MLLKNTFVTKKFVTILTPPTHNSPEVLLVELEQHVQPHPVLLEGDGVVGGGVGGDARAQEEPHPLLGRGHREGLLLVGGHGDLLPQGGVLLPLGAGDGGRQASLLSLLPSTLPLTKSQVVFHSNF